jgi:hypothetical protein
MVKRAIAIILGATAGAILWFAFDSVRAAELHADPNSQGCTREQFTACVSFVTPIEEFKPSPVAQPCKAYLSNTSGASIAALAQCLRAARQSKDLERLEQAKRSKSTAISA